MIDLVEQIRDFESYLKQLEGPLDAEERAALTTLYVQLKQTLAEQDIHSGRGGRSQ